MQKYHMIAYVLLYQKWWILQPPLILAVLSKWPFRPSLKLVALPRRTNFWNSFLAGASLSLGECNYPTGKQLKPHARVDGANTSHVLVTGLVHPFFSTKLGSGDRVHWSYVSIVFLSCLRYVEFKSGGWFLRFLVGQNSTENAEIFLHTDIEYVYLHIFYPQSFNGDQSYSNIHKGLFYLLIKIEKWAICTWKHHLALLVATGLTLLGFQHFAERPPSRLAVAQELIKYWVPGIVANDCPFSLHAISLMNPKN